MIICSEINDEFQHFLFSEIIYNFYIHTFVRAQHGNIQSGIYKKNLET